MCYNDVRKYRVYLDRRIEMEDKRMTSESEFSKIMSKLMCLYSDDPKLVKSFRKAKRPEDLEGWAYVLYMKEKERQRKKN